MTVLYRPILSADPARPREAVPLAGGPLWFDRAECIGPDGAEIVPVQQIPVDWLERLTAPRPALAGLTMDRPRIMGILNVTPDSFSDGGRHNAPDAAVAHAEAIVDAGADMIDVGGESTRPGAAFVSADDEIARTAPVIARIAHLAPVSLDTRKAAVARAGVAAGALLINDVSGFTHDPALAPYAAETGLPVCVMHMRGDPDTMNAHANYNHVVREVYAELEARIAAVEAQGIPRSRILADPGIGFAKTLDHNIALLRRLSVFHGLGCPLLLGVSRKRFIGTLAGVEDAAARMPGSLAVALAGVSQGVQMLRVHDVAETAQALRLWQAVHHG